MAAYTKRAFLGLVAAHSVAGDSKFHALLTKLAQTYGIDWMNRRPGFTAATGRTDVDQLTSAAPLLGPALRQQISPYGGWRQRIAWPAAAGAAGAGYPAAANRILRPPALPFQSSDTQQQPSSPTWTVAQRAADVAMAGSGLGAGVGAVASGTGKLMRRSPHLRAAGGATTRFGGKVLGVAGKVFKPLGAFDVGRTMINQARDPNATARDVARTGLSAAGDWAPMYGRTGVGSVAQGAMYLADRDRQTKEFLANTDIGGGRGATASNAVAGAMNPYKAIGSYGEAVNQMDVARAQEQQSNYAWEKRRAADRALKQQRWGRELTAGKQTVGGDPTERLRFTRRWMEQNKPHTAVAANSSGPMGLPPGNSAVPGGKTIVASHVLAEKIAAHIVAQKVAAQLANSTSPVNASTLMNANAKQIAKRVASSQGSAPLAQGLAISHRVNSQGSEPDNRKSEGLPSSPAIAPMPTGNTAVTSVSSGAVS